MSSAKRYQKGIQVKLCTVQGRFICEEAMPLLAAATHSSNNKLFINNIQKLSLKVHIMELANPT